MRMLLIILQKEFKQIFRNKVMLPIIFVMPIVQMTILVYAATMEIKNIDLLIVDQDLSATSRGISSHFQGSPFFNTEISQMSTKDAYGKLESDEADLILFIPANMEHDLYRNGNAVMQITANAINGMVAGIGTSIVSQTIMQYNRNLVLNYLKVPDTRGIQHQISTTYRYWYNPYLDSKSFMVPGILTILVTAIGLFLSGFNLVREKELGTIEQINVTPIKKYAFLAGKLIPFMVIALFDLTLGLLFGKLLFDVPIVGNILVMYTMAIAYLLVVLSLGLLLSTISSTQQQVLFTAFFFMIVFMLMSGLFTPTESMPNWAQDVNKINPIAHFMRAMRMILLKGSTMNDVLSEFFILMGTGIVLMSTAIWRYKKAS